MYYRNVKSRYNIIKFMEHRLQEIKLTSFVILPTYTLQGFVVFLSCKSEVAVLFP